LIETLLEEGFTSTDIASALIHQLQSGDGAAAKKRPDGEVERERPAREHDRRELPRHDRRERPSGDFAGDRGRPRTDFRGREREHAPTERRPALRSTPRVESRVAAQPVPVAKSVLSVSRATAAEVAATRAQDAQRLNSPNSQPPRP
jgi:hypothetical protein